MSGKNNFSISSKFFFVLILWVILNLHYEIKDSQVYEQKQPVAVDFSIWFMNWFNRHSDLQGQNGMWIFRKSKVLGSNF